MADLPPPLTAAEEREAYFAREAIDHGVSPQTLRCQEDAAHGCGEPGEPDCPRGGWILTPFDTWVACGVHGAGDHHPEDYYPED